MLRPATPLAVILFAAFAMLLLSVLSTPIIQAIPLGTFEGYNFGVFGYCKAGVCTPIEIGYDTANLFSPQSSATFDLPTAARTTLSAILVVHPVACLFTLIMLILAITAHWHGPSHSSRYLLVLFIFGIVTFLICLLSFLIDVLLFVPHMAWGSYIVCAATVLVGLGGLVSCAMRRTVVSRKARQKRIAENAEMSGENYYNRTAQQEAVGVGAGSIMQPTMPVVSGGNGPADNKLPTFATYEQKKEERSSEERIPLTAASPSQRSPNAGMSNTETYVPRSNSANSLPRDQYGNPIQQPDIYGRGRAPPDRMNSRGRGGPPPGAFRGRGGYGRGGYGPEYGPPPGGRGGYGPPGRGGYGPPQRGRGGYGPPRGGYGANGMRGGRPPPPGYGNAAYDRRQPPPQDMYGSYGPPRDVSPNPQGAPYGMNPPMASASAGTVGTGGYEAYNPDRGSDLPRAESPPPLPGTQPIRSAPVGQAVEMDARTGSPAHPPQNFGQFPNQHPNQLRDSDADVAGMLALQQARTDSPRRHDTYMSEGSKYSQEESAYVPARQAWNQETDRETPRMPSPLRVPSRSAADATPANNGGYYEDVDPRFAEPSAPRTLPPGAGPDPGGFDDPHEPGARSPAISERSTFTSISQRGVNPRWNPPPPGPPGAFGPPIPRKPANRNEVNVLNSNPDFQLPGSRNANSPARGGLGPYPGL